MQHVESHDLLKFGLIPELIGRLPVITPLRSLSREDMITILTEPKNALTKQYRALMKLDHVELEFDRSALEAVADKAIALDIGARGLRSVLENVMTDIMFAVPSEERVEKVIITGECVRGEASPELVCRKAVPVGSGPDHT